jgi:hypothetical protein
MSSVAPVSSRRWPDDPYKGLTFYTPYDVPLFAGREGDINSVSQMLGAGDTRILLLHGYTGCGKSSFLRAGLIPALEEEMRSYQFLIDPETNDRAFVRSTGDPTASLARVVFRSAKAVQQLRPEWAELGEAGFLKAVADDPRELVRLIESIASRIPRTLVLVIDQAEEVVTLHPGTEGDAARAQFFHFLSDISRSGRDLKVIIAFRTEYHGQFYAQLRYASAVDRVDDYFLADFNETQMIAAILRPTSDEEVPGYGKPVDHYQFTYDPGLPEIIAKSLFSTKPGGGVLPVLQIVCRRLYEKVKSTGPTPWRITEKLYNELGGLSGQIESHLEHEILAALDELGSTARSGHFVAFREVSRWRDVLSTLAQPQVNGTVTTKVLPQDDLTAAAQAAGCSIRPRDMFSFLSEEKRRILRPVDVTQVMTKDVIRCYSLGHDVLASVLQVWREQGKRAESLVFRFRLVCVVVGLASLADYLWWHKNWRWTVVAAAYAILALTPNWGPFRYFHNQLRAVFETSARQRNTTEAK